MTRRTLILVATALVALAAVATAQAAPPAKLLAKFQPVLVFHPDERFRPTSVETFVDDSQLELLTSPDPTAPGAWTVIDPDPDADSLPTAAPSLLRLNQVPCSAAAPVGDLDCYAEDWAAHGGPAVVYGRVLPVGDRVVVQYWLFYYDNLYSYTLPPNDFIWQSHEGDWEVVSVVLRRADDKPLYVAYSQHCLGERRSWSKAARWRGHHPIVYVAAGSHANYPSPGEHEFDARCVPLAAQQILAQAQLPLPKDYAGGLAMAGPARLGAETAVVERLTAGSAPWLAFPGRWGELQYFHAAFLPPPTTRPFGLAPPGPAFQQTWTDPLATFATWPVG